MRSETDSNFMSREQLTSLLEESIITGQLSEGQKLPSERVLADEYGVSRPVVRETLRGLSERGLVDVVPSRGTFVRRASMIDATRPFDTFFQRRRPTPRDLVEARRVLECEAATLAAERAGRDDMTAIGQALLRFEQSGGDLLEKVSYDVTFHASIARASGNPVIETMFVSISSTVAELMLRSLADPDVSREGLPYHPEIYEAIKDGDPERAGKAMFGHIAVAARTYGDDYDSPLEALAQRELRRRLDANMVLGLRAAFGNRSSAAAYYQ